MSAPQSEAFVVTGTRGQYSDRSEWVVAVMLSEADAQGAVTALKEAARALYAVYQQREDALHEADDWNGKTLLTTTDEGRAWTALHGDGTCPGDYDFEDMEFYYAKVPVHATLAAMKGQLV